MANLSYLIYNLLNLINLIIYSEPPNLQNKKETLEMT